MKSKWMKRIYIYRYDFLSFGIIVAAIVAMMATLFRPGQVVFSDLDFPFSSQAYMEEIIGMWNQRWNTVTALNIPRMLFVLPSFILASMFDHHGPLMLKAYIMQILLLSAVSMYILSKRIISVYFGRRFDIYTVIAVVSGALLYSINPWVIMRIQHVHLLAGYSMLPFIMLMFLNIFDSKFIKVHTNTFSFSSSAINFKTLLHSFLFAQCLTIASAAIHYFFYSVLLLGSCWFLLLGKYLLLYPEDRKNIVKTFFVRTLIVAGFFLALSAYWLLTYVGGILLGIGSSQNNINVMDTYHMFSRNASLSNVIVLQGYWWPMFDLNKLPLSYFLGASYVLFLAVVGAIRGIKANLLMFLALIAIALLLLSTGTYYKPIAPLFLFFANLPIIGSIFREPNKMVGLFVFPLSILLTFGLESLLRLLAKASYHRWLEGALLLLSAVMLFFFLHPMKYLYVDKYLQPIPEPEDYKALAQYFEAKDDIYAIYTPTAEAMIRPGIHISTPYWNVPETGGDYKPTGDIHIYQSPVDTLFHHEGNVATISHYFNFMQYVLDQGRSDKMHILYQGLGATHAIYHTEYLEQLQRQKTNEATLHVDEQLTSSYDNGLFHVFSVEDSQYGMVSSPRRIINGFGLSSMLSMGVFDWYHPLRLPSEFLQGGSFSLDSVKEEDIISIKSIDDMVMSSLVDEFSVDLFPLVDSVNPYMGFAKTYATQSTWEWYMEKYGSQHPTYESDYGLGVIFTFVSATIKDEFRDLEEIEGETVYSFNQLLSTEQFFTPDNPDLVEIIANPYTGDLPLRTIHGQLVAGEPNDIWQVAKSPLLEADENMPYRFQLDLSGRGVDKLHIKVRFFDAKQNELAIQYVVANDEYSDFDQLSFFGQLISPADTAYMRMDLLSLQKPEAKSYWWIHDVKIKQYPRIVEENALSLKVERSEGSYSVFLGLLAGEATGDMTVMINDDVYPLSSSKKESGFRWIDVASVEHSGGEINVRIVNDSGFNAINGLLLVPSKVLKERREDAREIANNHDLLIVHEAESTSYFDGNIQSMRRSPALSYGSGVAMAKGEVSFDFTVFSDSVYSLRPHTLIAEGIAMEGKWSLKRGNSVIAEDTMNVEESPQSLQQVDMNPLRYDHPYVFIPYAIEIAKVFPKEDIELFLESGDYTLTLSFDNKKDAIATSESLRYFDPSEIVVTDFVLEQFNSDCSTCERITEDMMTFTYGEGLSIAYEKTCSCDWYIATTDKIDVQAYDELYVTFSAKSENIEKRHGKVIFLDQYLQVIESSFIFEVEEWEKNKWNDYEQLVNTPLNARYAMVQFWARGDKIINGQLDIKDFQVHKYKDFPIVDYLSVTNVDHQKLGKITIARESNINGDRAHASFPEAIEGYVNTKLSPHKSWNFDGERFYLNGVTLGIYHEGDSLNGLVRLSSWYYRFIWLYILLTEAMVFAMIFRWLTRRRQK